MLSILILGTNPLDLLVYWWVCKTLKKVWSFSHSSKYIFFLNERNATKTIRRTIGDDFSRIHYIPVELVYTKDWNKSVYCNLEIVILFIHFIE